MIHVIIVNLALKQSKLTHNFCRKLLCPKKHSSLCALILTLIMSKRIEEELVEMNRLKRLELEFLFFQAKMDNIMLEKYRNALTNENTVSKDEDPDLQYV